MLVSTIWDFARIGTATIDWTDDSGAHSVSFSTGRYAHVDIASVTQFGSGGGTVSTSSDVWIDALRAAMDAATAQTITASRDTTTGYYAIGCSGSTFSINFVGGAGTIMRRLLGMTGNRSGLTSYPSQCLPRYTIRTHVDGRTGYTGPRKQGDVVQQWRTDAGTLGSLGPSYVPRLARWEHHFETPGHVWAHLADADTVSGGQQYTWEHLSEDAYQRGEFVALEDTSEPMVFQLLASPVGDGLRRMRPEMQQFAVVIDALAVGSF